MKQLSPFPLSSVKVTDPYCSNALSKENDYLLSLDPDRLLAGFRETAGLDTKGAVRYGGWENMLIGGHTMGHYLSALAQSCTNPGTEPEVAGELRARLRLVVDALLECQTSGKNKPGFLFAAIRQDPSDPEHQFDLVEHGRTNIITESWVPWYTMHKILAGLIDVYVLTGYENARRVASGIGDWTFGRTQTWSEETHRTVLSIEYGGMNEALYHLYAITGQEHHAIAAHCFDQTELFEKILAGAPDALNNYHANTTIPKFMGALSRYMVMHGRTVRGETVDASRYLAYAESFWTMVTENHTYITGANSEWEHFGRDKVLDAERTNANNESCNVYNMLKLSRGLFQVTGERKYADYYEQALLNAVLASQNPETGMSMYFQPMATGYFKVYGERFTKFWCCTGTGMENFTKLGDSLYFHSEDTVYVNLYLSSVLTWKEKGVTLTQVSDISCTDRALFRIRTDASDANIRLAFRLPAWLSGPAKLVRGGEELPLPETGGYAIVEGPFADGDELQILLPSKVQAHSLPDSASVICFTYGPLVLSADLGTEDEQVGTTGVDVTIPTNKIAGSESIPLPEGVTREEYFRTPERFLKYCGETSEDLAFSPTGTELVFRPHYLKVRERYGIYWYLLPEEEIRRAEEAKARGEEAYIDSVKPGYGQYESDALHAMDEDKTQGITEGGSCRYALAGGHFTYRMAVRPGTENLLSLTVQKADNGKTLRITCGDTVLYEDKLKYYGADESYTLRVSIPAELTDRAREIRTQDGTFRVLPFTFSGQDGSESARVCDFIYTQAR